MAFQKGQSGNPGGRPKENDEVKRLAQEHGPDAIKRLVWWMQSDNAKASVSASQALLDRGYGKPNQSLEVQTEVTHRYVARIPSISKDMDNWQREHGDKLTGKTVQ